MPRFGYGSLWTAPGIHPSEDGWESTISRLFEYDVSLLSASCVMPDMQFNVMIEAEKDSEFS